MEEIDNYLKTSFQLDLPIEKVRYGDIRKVNTSKVNDFDSITRAIFKKLAKTPLVVLIWLKVVETIMSHPIDSSLERLYKKHSKRCCSKKVTYLNTTETTNYI